MLEKAWYNVELNKEQADIFKDYLRKARVYYEPSEVGLMIHFECLMTREECNFADDFLSRVVFGKGA